MSEEQPETTDAPAVPTPDESAYNAMEIEAAAAGPMAEARRAEMQRWSDATGAHAEEAADQMSSLEKHLAKGKYSQEVVEKSINNAAQRIVANGVAPAPGRHEGALTPLEDATTMHYQPTEQGIVSTPSIRDAGTFDRSPAHIKSTDEQPATIVPPSRRTPAPEAEVQSPAEV